MIIRLSRAAVGDASALLLGAIGCALIALGKRLAQSVDDNLWTDWSDE